MAATRFDPVAHAKAMRAAGFWIDRNYDEFLQHGSPGRRTSWRCSPIARTAPTAARFTYAEIGEPFPAPLRH